MRDDNHLITHHYKRCWRACQISVTTVYIYIYINKKLANVKYTKYIYKKKIQKEQRNETFYQ